MFLYEGHRVKVTVTQRNIRCYPAASCFSERIYTTAQMARALIWGRHVSMTTENSTRQICPVYHMQTFLGGWP